MLSSDKRILLRLVITGLVLLAIGVVGFLMVGPYYDAHRLDQARREAESIFSTSSQVAQSNHAQKCVSYAKPLIAKRGPVGTTATLFLIGTSPMATGTPGQLAVPDDNRLAEVDLRDLLTSARLMAYSRSLGPADQLVNFLMNHPDADREDVLRLAITVRYDLGRDEDVLKHCDELSELSPADFRPHQVKATVFRNRTHWDHFVDAATRAIELAEQHDALQPVDLIELMDGYLHLGETAKAREQFDRIQQRWPDVLAEMSTLHARLLIQEGDVQQAEPLLIQSVQKDPKDVETLVLLGTMLVGEERFQDAIEVLEMAIHHSRTEERAFYQLGQAHARLGDEERAKLALEAHRFLLDEKVRLHELEQQAAREPDNVDVRRELAQSYARLGLEERSEFWLRAAQAIGP